MRRPGSGMFGSESELCDLLMTTARAQGYRVHPETSDWDVLLVCRETGDQIGVQAKLRPSIGVLSQALTSHALPGPDVHAVLVPQADADFLAVAKWLRLTVITGVDLVSYAYLKQSLAHAKRWEHPARAWVPEAEIILPAGMPSPRKVTPWKLGAVELCLRIRERGYATRADMRELKLHPKWWFHGRYPMLTTGERGHYVLADPSSPLVPDLRWPEVTSAIETTRKPVV